MNTAATLALAVLRHWVASIATVVAACLAASAFPGKKRAAHPTSAATTTKASPPGYASGPPSPPFAAIAQSRSRKYVIVHVFVLSLIPIGFYWWVAQAGPLVHKALELVSRLRLRLHRTA